MSISISSICELIDIRDHETGCQPGSLVEWSISQLGLKLKTEDINKIVLSHIKIIVYTLRPQLFNIFLLLLLVIVLYFYCILSCYLVKKNFKVTIT